MAVALAVSVPARRSHALARRAIARGVREVAEYLGNTPAVCRASYIDPRVIDRYLDGRTVTAALDSVGGHVDSASRETMEAAVIGLLARQRSQPSGALEGLPAQVA